MIHLRKGILIISLILISAITFAQVSITVNVPTAGGFSAALTASGGDANSVTNLTVTGNINATDIAFMNKNMPLLVVLDMENAQVVSNFFPNYAFSDNVHLKSIKLPNSLTRIGTSAFYNCIGLTCNLTIPSKVTIIDSRAFQNCSGLTGNLVIPNSVTFISSFAFAGCSGFSGDLIIPNSVTYLANDVFLNCSGFNGNLIIPNSISTIRQSTFSGCTGLKGYLTIPNSVTSIESYAFVSCSGFTGDLTIPNSVKSIGDRVFLYCSGFSSLTISNSITSIGAAAFSFCTGITGNLNIPNTVITIGNDAFSNCNRLVGDLTVPNSVTSIGDMAFGFCSGFTGTLTIPSSVTSIGNNSFNNCIGINEIKVAQIVPLEIGSGTFYKINKTTCQLIVPYGATAAYRAANYWKDFNNITEQIYVAFNSQGGTPVADLTTIYNTTIIEPPVPTRIGYTFAGWYKEAACTSTWNFASDLVTDNTTLYAKWNINSYVVTFNSQGGSAVDDITANYNTNITVPTAPTRTGYTFGGWYKEAACTNAWSFASDLVTDNTTLYAKWNINSYVVTFNSQGGSAVASINTNFNTRITAPTAPTLIGYIFGGWYKEAACTNVWDFTTNTVTTNTTLYAKWTIIVYTVTFNSQGGSAVASVNANYNATISVPSAPTRTGYTFGGWFKEAACINTWTFATDRVTATTTLYAKWTINTYTVTFNSNGGTPVASVSAIYNSKISEPTSPTKTGYTFAGWYINLTDDFSFNFNLYMITSNLTLQAKWVPNTYYVTFYSEGTIVDSRGAEYNTTVERPEDPIRTGHIFNGWYKEPTFITLWNFGADKVISDMSLYAKWTPITYTVTFNSQGGSPVSSVLVNHGTKVAEPAPPVRNGYTLRGWYDQPIDGFIWFFDYNTVTEDITLYAHWDINSYTITFDSKGGSSVESKTAKYNSTITAPSTPTRTGYTFAGWYKDEALTSAWNFDSDVVTANATLFAKWDVNTYIVSFDSQGGSNINYIEAEYGSTITRPVDPTKTGYTFVGWFKDQALSNEWNFSTDIVTNHMYLYAKWMINLYTVTFNPQGGSAISNLTANYNSTITAPSVPTRTGYTFDGWYKEASCINQWAFATDVIVSDITLYAKWTTNTYTVTFNTQGGSAISNVNANYSSTITAPSAPTRTGYTFDGWYKEAGCVNPWVFTSDVVTSDITLYAKWNLSSDVETVLGNNLKLYPNPTVDKLTIEGERIEEVVIYSVAGFIVKQPVKNIMQDSFTFNVDELKSGIHIAKIRISNNRVFTIRFVKL